MVSGCRNGSRLLIVSLDRVLGNSGYLVQFGLRTIPPSSVGADTATQLLFASVAALSGVKVILIQ